MSENKAIPDQLLQIVAHQWFTARESQLQRPQVARFAQHARPLLGTQLLRGVVIEVQRVVAPAALERATVGQLQGQP